MRDNHHCLMRRIVVAVWFATLVHVSPSQAASAAQDTSERITAAFDLIEFNGAADPAKIHKALDALNGDDIAKLCKMLVEPGTGNDTKPRMTLHALAIHVGQKGRDGARRRFVRALSAALSSDAPKSVTAFLVRQLQWAADAEAAPALAPLLLDERLCSPATEALLAIGGVEAASALRGKLPNATGTRRVAIITALGLLRDRRSIPLMTQDVSSQDHGIRFAALAALANMGENAILKAVTAATRSKSWYERSMATALSLKYAVNEEGQAMLAVYAQQLSFAKPEELRVAPHFLCALLYEVARSQGPAAVRVVLAAMTSGNDELRAAATDIAVALGGKGVTAAYLGRLAKAAPAARAAIVEVLGRRGGAAALPAVSAALADEDADVRLAAVTATAALGGEHAVKPLAKFLETLRPRERKAAQRELIALRGDAVSKRIAAVLPDVAPPARAALLEVLLDRDARDQLDVVFNSTGDSDEAVRVAAVNAVGVLADEHAAPRLLVLLRDAKGERERGALETAVAAVCNRAASISRRAAPVLAILDSKQTDTYASLLRVLGRIGGKAAFAAVRKATGDQRPAVQDAAYRALTTWPRSGVAGDVLELARSTENVRHHVFAMRAYARLVGLDSSRSADESLAMYQAGMQAARRADERKLLLSKIGELKTTAALAALEPFLLDNELSAESASAMLTAADGLLPAGWVAAREAVGRVMAASPPEAIRARAAALEKRIAEFEDFITDWRTAGPYSVPGKKGNEILDTVFAPERTDAGEVEWQKQPVTTDPARYWMVDMTRVFNGANRAGYLYTRIFSAKAQPIRLELGSDDGLKVWLNGENIHTNNALRGCAPAQDIVKASLRKGVNELLLKVTNNGGGWGACVRVRAPDGGRLEGIRVSANGNRD